MATVATLPLPDRFVGMLERTLEDAILGTCWAGYERPNDPGGWCFVQTWDHAFCGPVALGIREDGGWWAMAGDDESLTRIEDGGASAMDIARSVRRWLLGRMVK